MTGAVGCEIVRGLCESQNYDKIVVWARRELKFSHEKLEVQIVNLDKIKEIEPCDIDEIFCALGTTMKQAGSRGRSPFRAYLRLRRGRTVEIFLHESKGQGREKDRRAGF